MRAWVHRDDSDSESSSDEDSRIDEHQQSFTKKIFSTKLNLARLKSPGAARKQMSKKQVSQKENRSLSGNKHSSVARSASTVITNNANSTKHDEILLFPWQKDADIDTKVPEDNLDNSKSSLVKATGAAKDARAGEGVDKVRIHWLLQKLLKMLWWRCDC